MFTDGAGQARVELQAVAADGDGAEQHGRADDLSGSCATEPAGEEADVAVADDHPGRSWPSTPVNCDHPAEPGERAADEHRADEDERRPGSRPGGPPRRCRRRPARRKPQGVYLRTAHDHDRHDERDEDAGVHAGCPR